MPDKFDPIPRFISFLEFVAISTAPVSLRGESPAKTCLPANLAPAASRPQIQPSTVGLLSIPQLPTPTLQDSQPHHGLIKSGRHSLMSVTLHTTAGDIKIEVFCESTPKTAEVSFPNQSIISVILLNPYRIFSPSVHPPHTMVRLSIAQFPAL